MRGMTRAMLVCGLAMLSAGCGAAFKNDGRHVVDVDRDHPITVTSQLVTEEVGVPVNARSLSEDVSNQVQRLATDFVRRGGGLLEIAVPVGETDRSAAMSRARLVKGKAISAGAEPREIKIRLSDVAANGPIVVSYEAFTATPPKCRPTEKNFTLNYRNTGQDTYGCVTQHNLSIMLSRPADRAKSGVPSRYEAQRRSRVVTDHRSGTQPSSDGGIAAGPASGF